MSTFFPLRASLATGTQDLYILKNVQSSVQITFHLRSKIRSKGFRKTFNPVRTENALFHKPFVQNADSAVIFINPCPEICILKAGKCQLLNLSSSRKEFPMATLCASICVFSWDMAAMRRLRKAQAECMGYGYTEATMCSSPTRTPPFAQTAYVEGVLSKKQTLQKTDS